jgi:DNA-binding GntR family transcriptional regulator
MRMSSKGLATNHTITDEISSILRREIFSGVLAPGTPLPQNDLAARFGVSTTPIREALRVLRQEGVAVGDSHQRVVVFRPTSHDLRENAEMRIALETLATKLAVPRLDAYTLAEMESLLSQMVEVGNQDAERYPPLNRAFHLTLYAAADRPRLLATIADLRAAAAGFLRIFADLSGDPTGPETEHQAIFEACRAGQAERAAELMEEHLQHVFLTVEQILSAERSRS